MIMTCDYYFKTSTKKKYGPTIKNQLAQK